jgi:hypothetical protein
MGEGKCSSFKGRMVLEIYLFIYLFQGGQKLPKEYNSSVEGYRLQRSADSDKKQPKKKRGGGRGGAEYVRL